MTRISARRAGQGVVWILASVVCLASVAPAHAQSRDLEAIDRLASEIARDLERVVGHSAALIATGVVHDVTRSLVHGLDPALRASAASGLLEQSRDYRTERVERSTRSLALGPTGLLELKNLSGDITVTAGSGREVVLEIVRRSRARNETDAARGLRDVEVAVDHRGERASVETVYPRGNTPYQVTTTYTVTAPSGTRLSARSISGSVSIRDIQGDVAAETVSGSVSVTGAARVSKARTISGDVTLTDINGDSVLAAGTVSGGVELLRVRARRVSVDVVSGAIRAMDVVCDSALLKSLSGSVEFAGPLAGNGRYELGSHSGSVRVVAEGPVGFELQASTFSGRIRPEGLSLQAMTTSRGSLRGRVGDGSAVVVAQTFSGDVVIGKK